jgi:hypothetical protein
VLLLKYYKRFNLLIYYLLLRYLFSIDILVVINTVLLFISRALGYLCYVRMRAFSWILTIITSVISFG